MFNVTGETSYEWDTINVGDGAHTIGLVAYDKAGNTATTHITVTTTNVQRATEESYAAGREEGYEEGYATGREEGYAIGRSFGMTIGVLIGVVVGSIGGAVVVFAIAKKLKK